VNIAVSFVFPLKSKVSFISQVPVTLVHKEIFAIVPDNDIAEQLNVTVLFVVILLSAGEFKFTIKIGTYLIITTPEPPIAPEPPPPPSPLVPAVSEPALFPPCPPPPNPPTPPAEVPPPPPPPA